MAAKSELKTPMGNMHDSYFIIFGREMSLSFDEFVCSKSIRFGSPLGLVWDISEKVRSMFKLKCIQ